MAEASDIREMFRQNLIGAGCSQEVVAQCMKLKEKRNAAQLMRVLAWHRRSLLDNKNHNFCFLYVLTSNLKRRHSKS